MNTYRKLLFRSVLAFVVVAIHPPISYAAVGRTVGDANVSSAGEATYSIPISVPAGINGLTPELALTYAHRQEEGLAGVGWGISGLSEITRCVKTFAQDGAPISVQLATNDRYCLDGNQLRLISGTYGAAGSTYRAEIDLMARITANGTAGNGPAWFRVEHKNGLFFEYGNSTDSRIETLATGFGSTARAWLLNRIADRQGNEIKFSYQEDGAPNGDYRISSVQYRSNPGQGVTPAYSVNLIYETQPPGDIDTEYGAGGRIDDVKRLDRIDVWYTVPWPDTLVRRYELTYETNLSSTGRSRLQSVQECAGFLIDCFTATTFTYQDGTNDLDAEVSSGSTISAGLKPLILDINGDGRSDLVYQASGKWMYQLANATGGYEIAVNSGIDSTNYDHAIAIEFNGDGIDDILVPYDGNTWWVIQGSTTGLTAPINTNTTLESNYQDAAALDANGDGREDLIWGVNVGTTSGTGRIRAKYREGSGFSSTITNLYTAPANHHVGAEGDPLFDTRYNQNRSQYFDVNGDGYKDIPFVLWYYEEIEEEVEESFDVYVLLGGGQGLMWVFGNDSVGMPIDLNGDGYTDIVYLVGSIKTRLATGKSFAPAVTAPTPATGYNFYKAVVMDWDGDGFQDLVLPKTSTNTWHVMPSVGTSLGTAFDTQIATSNPINTFRVDANGDGLDDIGYVKSNGVYAHLPHSGIKPDLLKTATDGNGNAITFNYTSIVQGAYTKYTTSTFPDQDYIGPIYVVESADLTNGIGGTYTLTYDYAGAQLNLQGRSLSGFDKKSTHDSRSDITITEYFHRDFPLRSRRYQSDMRLGDNTLVQQLTSIWETYDGGSGFETYQFPYEKSTTEKNYEAGGAYNGIQINEIVTTVTVDAYGTPYDTTTVTTEHSDANGAQPNAWFREQLLLTNITNNVATWCLGKPGQSESINSHSETSGEPITRTSTLTWDTTVYCRLDEQIIEPLSSTYKVTKAIGYDAFGNVNSETITGIGMAARTTTTNWGSTGQYPISATNALNQTTTMSWDYAKGLQTLETDPNGIAVSWQYDDFGRLTREVRPDSTYTDHTLTDCNVGNSFCGTSYDKVKTQLRASSRAVDTSEIRFDDSFLDIADRVVQEESQTISGSLSRVRTIYDSQGRVSQQSAPDFLATPNYYTATLYDSLNRPTRISRPIDETDPTPQYTFLYYEGLTTRTTDAEGKNTEKILDALGRVFRSVDHAGYYQQFDYDAFGSIRRVVDNSTPANNLLQATYAYGIGAFRLTSNDMDMGLWTYTPNALGEVVGYTDAKLQNFSATFDKLSRPWTRTEAEGVTTWNWGTSATNHNIGRLESVSSPGHSESFDYDDSGRLIHREINADTIYDIDYAYNANTGLLDTLTYPTSTSGYRLKLKYDYQNGILSTVSNDNPPYGAFWQANASDARGNIVDSNTQNGMETQRGFDAVTGLPNYIQSGIGGGAAKQNMEYKWDKVGNLKQRKDLNRSLTEDFYYDNLHRLDYSELNQVQNLDVSYDDMGNITSKDDVGTGTWAYHSTKKHAVINAAGNIFTYDDNGNQKTRNSDDIDWTSFNYPSHIENGSEYHDYSYDANRQRWKQEYFNGSSVETTIYVGGILEKRTVELTTEYRHYIHAGNSPVMIYERRDAGEATVYLLLNHQGSVASMVSSNGSTHVDEDFAAFGERRDPADWSGPPSAQDKALIATASERGYTFHTNLNESSLIHMNGRVANGLTGRFLSADPYIPNPNNTQSFNRYSYVRNNPLSYTDPSGFCEGVCVYVVKTIASSIVGSFFGRKKYRPPPPKGCFVPAAGCYGQAGMTSVPQINSNVMNFMPNTNYGHEFKIRIGLGRISIISTTRNAASDLIIYARSPGNETDGDSILIDREAFKDALIDRLIEEAIRVITEHEEVQTRQEKDDIYTPDLRTFVDMDIDAMGRLVSLLKIGKLGSNLVDIGIFIATRRVPLHKGLIPERMLPGQDFDVSGWTAACPPKGTLYVGHCGFYDPDLEFHDVNDILPPGSQTRGHNSPE